eukprot:GFKZ01005948.1.p1 GENE.GFKZ01005948.1~~GFKZ01005948.1.p1  ORF type:complete len:576 (-),score=75.62 GFKZ01005948.1:836-2563(-)
MPLPRKNVSRDVPRNDEHLDIIVEARKPEMFDWDEMGLGLGAPSTSSSSSHSDDTLSHGTLVILPEKPKPTKLAKTPKTPKKPPLDKSQIEASEWVRNLIECRKEKRDRISLDDHGFRTTGKGWLVDQHKALADGSISVTFKCIIAASDISEAFNECRDTFKRPEYRSRYWSWAVNFILLVDYYIDNGNIKVTPKAPDEYKPLIEFLKQCKAQKNSGNLALQRDHLLTAMGIVWDKVKPEVENEEDEEEISDDSSVDNQEDETWQLPSKHKIQPRSASKRTSRKRKRRASPRGKAPRGLRQKVSECPPLQSVQRPAPPTPDALRAWSRKIVTLRGYYRKTPVEDDIYVFPASRMPLRIWMNAEVGRCSAGILSEICSGILLAAEMADRSEVGQLSTDCENWGRGFIAYLDYFLRNGKPLQICIDFLYDCWRRYQTRILTPDRGALLSGVDENWFDSRHMKKCVLLKEKALRESRLRAPTIIPRKESNPAANGHFTTVASDYDSSVECVNVPKKRKKAGNLVQQMLTSMIGGEIAATIEGRNPTAAERRAKEWVLSAEAETINAYAKRWFRAAERE